MTHIRKSLKFFIYTCLAVAIVVGGAFSVQAQNSPRIVRDTEIENILHEWIAPLVEAANLPANSVNLVLVQSPQINAFVAGGANIFIFTGLIEKTEKPEELLGVLAHELGHISGGHLIAQGDAMDRASFESILGMALGIGAAILTGSGEAANAIMTGANSLAYGRFLAHSRAHESAADQAALKYLEGAEINPNGLKDFFRTLESEELLPASQQSAYMRTHPLTRDRVDALETKIQHSEFKTQKVPAKWSAQHVRMKAKLRAFIDPGRVPWVYRDSDESIPARYARAIAAYRSSRVDRALSEIDGLIALEPDNPYFQELKGQMLLDFGRVEQALPYYRSAVQGAPKAGLIRIALGKALVQSADRKDLQEAINVLQRAVIEEPRSTQAHRLLATAFGRLGREDMAKLHLAEEAVLQRRFPDARKLAEEALARLEKGSREAIKAQDILNQIEHLNKK